MEHDIHLSIGTNLGDRIANLRAALEAMPPEVEPVAISRVYETPPWGYTDQPAFLNMAVHARTGLGPESLLRKLKQVETRIGRKPGIRWGPRLLDIDILFYDDLLLDMPGLQIPHPRLAERAFVLAPLVDLAPDLCYPGNGHSLKELLEHTGRSGVRLFSPA